ncbi:MAG TPA: hypothetical protein VFJ16_16965 [Longimicrobium sp.]|nr:hypothetical protein [Longimicrobium sp.]
METRSSVMERPAPEAIFLATPDLDFRLTDADRARLTSGVDLTAFEALLARMRPEFRARMVDDLAEICAVGRVSFGPPSFPGITDPEILRLLEAAFRFPDRE